jgi:hypothetical protein
MLFPFVVLQLPAPGRHGRWPKGLHESSPAPDFGMARQGYGMIVT